MSTDYNPFPITEMNKNANGGTELMARAIQQRIAPELLNEFQIHCSRVFEQNPEKIQLYWAHDLALDPAAQRFSDPFFRKKFAKLIFVSNWQFNDFMQHRGVAPSEGIVIPNGIESFERFAYDVKWLNMGTTPIKIIHHCAPHKSLSLVVPIFIELAKHHKNIELHLFSSFQLYGSNERDKEFKQIFDMANNHPNIFNHGTVSQSELRLALVDSHIFLHPSLFPETSCIALMEAMSANCFCVHPNFGALPETSGGITPDYAYSENIHEHFTNAFEKMSSVISYIRKGDTPNYIVPALVNNRNHIDRIAVLWKKHLLAIYKTVKGKDFAFK